MKNNFIGVTTWNLQNDDITINFSNQDPNDVKLKYQVGSVERIFIGKEILVEKQVILESTFCGLIVSVVLDDGRYDRDRLFLSLFLPHGNRPENMKSISIDTFGVKTVSKSGIGGPSIIEGQIQIYEILKFQGNAW